MPNLFPPPPQYVLPVSRGGDLDFTLTYKVDGVATNYPAGISMTVVIDRKKTDPLVVATSIEGAVATVRVQSDIADALLNGELWRAIRHDTNQTPTADLVVCNGTIKRFDGTG